MELEVKPEHGRDLPPFIVLWHPNSPGTQIIVRPCIWRRLGLVRSAFATIGEVLAAYRDQRRRGC